MSSTATLGHSEVLEFTHLGTLVSNLGWLTQLTFYSIVSVANVELDGNCEREGLSGGLVIWSQGFLQVVSLVPSIIRPQIPS